jgi:IclR family acetate operon transcriptional repressor
MVYIVEQAAYLKELPLMPQLVVSDAKVPRIQSLARADAILTVVMTHAGQVSLAALSKDLGLNKTTVFNLAESLVLLGYLERTAQPKGYRLGLRCLELGRHVAKNLPILELSRPSLRELCQATRETVNLAVPYLHEGIILEALQSAQAVRATAYAGARTNYHSSACGKAMLAYFPEDQRRWLYDNVGLPKMTEYTITDPVLLEADLQTVRDLGYASDRQENEIGAYCVGMPIFDPFNEVAGAISVSGVIQRMTPDLIAEIVALLRHHTRSITAALGGT